MAAKRPSTLMAAIRYFDRDTAQRYIESIKWSEGPVCPACGSVNVGTIKSRNRSQCRDCRRQFSLTTGTIMEATHLRLDQWLVAVWMIVNCRNGVSSCEIARAIGCKQQSAWHLLHRVRHILAQAAGEPMGQRGGVCEADWTYVGGLVSNMPHERRERARRQKNYGKVVVHAIKERRSGTVRASVLVDGARRHPIRAQIRSNVAPNARLYTDEAKVYKGWTYWEYRHDAVNHEYGQYVNGTVHTNGCENFFNCLRRTVKGTYIKPTPEHLAAYVDEVAYRFNVRHESEWDRFDGAMRQIVGKRLTYSELTGGAVR
ncbi:MAG: IS1595 family transposase [Phycisphaerales bacterium JB039]